MPKITTFLDRSSASGGLNLDQFSVLTQAYLLSPDVFDAFSLRLPAGPPVAGKAYPVRLHSYVAGGLLDAVEVERRLLDAARACGLSERRAIDGIRDAARVARDHPKHVPDPPPHAGRAARGDRDWPHATRPQRARTRHQLTG